MFQVTEPNFLFSEHKFKYQDIKTQLNSCNKQFLKIKKKKIVIKALICTFNFECKLKPFTKSENNEVVSIFEIQFAVATF